MLQQYNFLKNLLKSSSKLSYLPQKVKKITNSWLSIQEGLVAYNFQPVSNLQSKHRLIEEHNDLLRGIVLVIFARSAVISDISVARIKSQHMAAKPRHNNSYPLQIIYVGTYVFCMSISDVSQLFTTKHNKHVTALRGKLWARLNIT